MLRNARRLVVPVLVVALFATTMSRDGNVYATNTPLLDAIGPGTATFQNDDPRGLPTAAYLAAIAASRAARTAAVRRGVKKAVVFGVTAYTGSQFSDWVDAFFFGGYMADGYNGLDDSLFDF